MQNGMDKDMEVEVGENRERGRWGYLVCFGMIITYVAGIGHVNSFGLIYNDFITETNSSAKSLTVAHGVFAIMLAFGGILLNILKQKFSLRQGGLLGALLFTLGSLSSIPITKISQLSLTFGVMQGLGFGMMVIVCNASLNFFFVKRRTMAMSVCKAAQGVILMGYPQLIKFLTNFYGFRGTLLILSAISLHPIAGMLIMRTKETKIRTANKNDPKVDKELLNLVTTRKSEEENAKDEKSCNNKGIGFQIMRIFDLKALKDPVFCNMCLGQSFVNFSDLSFFILQPMLLFQYGYDRIQVATCISICSGADMVGRFIMIAVTAAFNINTRLLFYLSTLATFITRIVLLQVRQYLWVAIGTAVLGLLRACLHITSPLVISNHVSNEDFPGAYGLSILAAGVVNVMISPLIGLLKDSYQDYAPAFYALAACCLPCLLFWPLEFVLRKKISNKT